MVLRNRICSSATGLSSQGLTKTQMRFSFLLYTGYVRNGTGLHSHFKHPIYANGEFRTVLKTPGLKKTSAAEAVREESPKGPQQMDGETQVNWDEQSSADVVALTRKEESKALQAQGQKKPARPYVPLGEVSIIERRGDYCMEGGRFEDALHHFGVVAKAFQLAYPNKYHEQHAHIAIKLGRAFRLVGDPASAKKNFERGLEILEGGKRPEVELVAETLLEYAHLKAELKDSDAGSVYEDCLAVVNEFHDLGASHRLLRLMPRTCMSHHAYFAGKHVWYSLKDWDRTYAIVDAALDGAEKLYRANKDQESVVRVLEARSQITDRKFFNLRNDCGKIGIQRGGWKIRAAYFSSAPSPDDILRFSPTVHQPYRDYSLENTAPITFGEQAPVALGANRKVQDDGNPLRFRVKEEKELNRRSQESPMYQEEELVRW